MSIATRTALSISTNPAVRSFAAPAAIGLGAGAMAAVAGDGTGAAYVGASLGTGLLMKRYMRRSALVTLAPNNGALAARLGAAAAGSVGGLVTGKSIGDRIF